MNSRNIILKPTLEEELKVQQFQSEYQKLSLNIIHTANLLEADMSNLLKTHNITNSQYNVLRILRGNKGHTMSVCAIQERMLHRNSNVTRILDKLFHKELVDKFPNKHNRRMIEVRLLPKGFELLKKLDLPVLERHQELEDILKSENIENYNNTLNIIRHYIKTKKQ